MVTAIERLRQVSITGVAKEIVQLFKPLMKEEPPPSQPAMGFFTDTSVCIGCKACEVACKQWNELPAIEPMWTGTSYDNTQRLGATTWRHVQFIEKIERRVPKSDGAAATAKTTVSMASDLPLFEHAFADTRTLNETVNAARSLVEADGQQGIDLPFFNSDRWLMHSDVCKHCRNAPCQEVCPTGAIIRTEFDTVYVQQDICNGCSYCNVACPFGVIEHSHEAGNDGKSHKCTLCYDRMKDGMTPACAKACPTESIQFGNVEELRQRAQERLGFLHARGLKEARLFGADEEVLEGGLNSFFLLLDEPEVYNLPRNPLRPVNNVLPTSLSVIAAAALMTLAGLRAFRKE